MPNRRFNVNTPVGNLYGGLVNTNKNGYERNGAYAGLGGYGANLTAVNDPYGRTSYHAGIDMPTEILPDYYKEFSTPFGSGHLATNLPEAGLDFGFMPNERTQAYITALSQLLGL